MYKCRDIAHHASDYLDGHLSRWQRLGFALHLLMCGHCRAFLRQLRLALSLYKQLPEPELTPEQAASIVGQVLGDRRPPG